MRTRSRSHARTALGAAALTLATAAGGCGGGPSTYLVELLGIGDAPAAAATLLPRPGE